MSKDDEEKGIHRRIGTGTGYRKVSGKKVAEALGAEPDSIAAPAGRDPVSLLGLIEASSAMIASSGGRPGRQGATERVKVSMTPQEWQDLQEIANIMNDLDFSVAAGQVAALLLHSSIEALKPDIKEIHSAKDSYMAAAANAKGGLGGLEEIAEESLKEMQRQKVMEAIPGLRELLEKNNAK